MSKKTITILLAVVMVACFAGALSYPLLYSRQKADNEAGLETLRALRDSAREQEDEKPGESAASKETSAEELPVKEETEAAVSAPGSGSTPETEAPISAPGGKNAAETEADSSVAGSGNAVPIKVETSVPAGGTASPSEEAEAQPSESPAPTRAPYTGAQAYPNKEKKTLNEDDILPQYREIYELNHDMVGWLTLKGAGIDHPVLQNEDDNYYLKHDFYGRNNINGQLLIFSVCDVYTPSYNIVIAGHNMTSGKMFGHIMRYESRSFWAANKTLRFDTLTREGTYAVVAAFYSADYDENEKGFRYLADIQYPADYRQWIAQVRENALYDTGVDTEFGDEFLTLTTCAYQRRNGRFVVVARRLREGESIE